MDEKLHPTSNNGCYYISMSYSQSSSVSKRASRGALVSDRPCVSILFNSLHVVIYVLCMFPTFCYVSLYDSHLILSIYMNYHLIVSIYMWCPPFTLLYLFHDCLYFQTPAHLIYWWVTSLTHNTSWLYWQMFGYTGLFVTPTYHKYFNL